MKLLDLLTQDFETPGPPTGFIDPFTDGSLVEGVVAWYIHDIARNRIAVSLDLRNSLVYEFEGIGLLRMDSISELVWHLPESGDSHIVIGAWEIEEDTHAISLGIGFCGSGTLRIRCANAIFHWCICADDPPQAASDCELIGLMRSGNGRKRLP